ncbi:MAG: proton-conducting transporter transmembrane domain-containing protein [Anaerolineae bacterium]
MIAGPILFLALLAVGAGSLYLLRRLESLAALLAAGLSTLLAVGLWRLPLSTPVRIAGRVVMLGQPVLWEDISLQITPAGRAVTVFLLSVAAVTFLLAWRTYQGRTFYPFGLLLLALWGGIAFLQPLTLAPFGVVLAALLAVFLIQAGRSGQTQGAWRQLLFPALALPLFVVAAWYMDQAPLNPEDPTPYRVASWLLVVGFAFLLQLAPLHAGLPAVAGQAPAVVAAFLWIGGQTITLFLLQRFLVTYPWLNQAVDSTQWLLWLGMFTAVLGGTLAAVQVRLGQLVGYAALYDYGVLVVALSLRGTAGLPTAIWMLLTRTVALLTMATGAAALRHYMTSDAFDRLRGAVSRLPWSVAALIGGGLGLVGAPLSAQFASRWALFQLLSENDPRWVLLLLLAALGLLIGVVRGARACFGDLSASPVERETSGLALLAFLLLAAGALVGLFPQLLIGPVGAVILPLSTLAP